MPDGPESQPKFIVRREPMWAVTHPDETTTYVPPVQPEAPAPPEGTPGEEPPLEEPKRKGEPQPPRKRPSKIKRGRAAAITALGLVLGGLGACTAVEILDSFHGNEPLPPPTSLPTGTVEPTVEPTPTETTSPTEVLSVEQIKQNIEYFFNNADYEMVQKWGNENMFVGGGTFTKSEAWHFPVVGDTLNVNVDNNTIFYPGGLQDVKSVPQFSELAVNTYVNEGRKYYWAKFIGVDLGVYKIKGNYILALGLIPNPQLASRNPDGSKYVQFFKMTFDGDKFIQEKDLILDRYYKVKGWDGSFYTLGGVGQGTHAVDSYSVDLKHFLASMVKNVGNIVFVGTNDDDQTHKDIYNLGAMAPYNQFPELGALFQEFMAKHWIVTPDQPFEVPSDAPTAVEFGELSRSTQFLPQIKK